MLGGKYRLERLLGEGGMGAVFAATNEWTGKRVAIKTLHAEHMRRASAMERFWQEARAATKIEHPGIVVVFDLGVDEATKTPFIVQELLQGQTLRQLLEGCTTLAPREAVELLIPVVEALVEAHKVGVVHRDLKPDNLFLTQGSGGTVVPKLIDFGISKLMEDGTATGAPQGPKTGTGFLLGTASYMSPEQAAGQHKLVDAQTDVWAIGVVLYEVLTGRLPFEAETDSLTQAKIIYEAAVPVKQRNPALPGDLAAIVDGTLVRDRAQRCASAAVLLEALRGCSVMHDGAVTAPRAVAVVPEAVVAGPATTMGWDTPTAEAPAEPKPGRHGWKIAASAALVVMAAVLGVVVGNRPPRYTVSAPMVVRSNPVTVSGAADAGAVVAPAPVTVLRAEPVAVVAPVAVAVPVAVAAPARPVQRARVVRRPVTPRGHARPGGGHGALAPIGTYP